VTEYSPTDLATQLKSGLLSFPVTHFAGDLEVDEAGYRKHVSWLSEYPVAGLFAAGGTGEGFSLTFDETDRVVRAAVEEVAGRVPVLAPATGSTRNAVAQAKAAEAAGADGLLLMPPYLTESSQAGLVEHVSQVCQATNLGVVVYSRANAVLHDHAVATLADRNPTLIGFKDGVGNIGLALMLALEAAYLLSGSVGIMLGHDILDTLFIYGMIVTSFIVLGGPPSLPGVIGKQAD
jgi:5-dehydro-4-deoxyglucarate dehydratase